METTTRTRSRTQPSFERNQLSRRKLSPVELFNFYVVCGHYQTMNPERMIEVFRSIFWKLNEARQRKLNELIDELEKQTQHE